MNPNRIATVLAVITGIATAVAPVLANADWQSTAGIVAGGLAAVLAILKWLDGWQKHEANVAMTTGRTVDGKGLGQPR